MQTKADKKENLRREIISASHIYRDCLAGKVFLYVFGNAYFEVVFRTDCFMHLTGVASRLGALDFYNKAKSSTLSTAQFYFDNTHSYKKAKQKLPCLIRLPELTTSLVCVVKDMKTVTLTYKIGVTNLSFTLGLMENVDSNGHKINDWFLPRTLRIKDKAIENSSFAEFIDFIFVKDASMSKYSNVLFSAQDNETPIEIKGLLNEDLVKQLYKDI